MVHPDAEGDPLPPEKRQLPPIWLPNFIGRAGSEFLESPPILERREREAWVRRVHARALRGIGLGAMADDPDGSDVKKFFRKLPPELLRQREVMQTMLAPNIPAVTTRFSHQVDCALIAGLIAGHGGLPRNLVENATLATLVHDIGHYAFAHSSESAIEKFLRDTNPSHAAGDWDHAANSGLVIARFDWDPNSETSLDEIIYAVSNHSWSLRHGRTRSPRMAEAGLYADLAGAADRISYSITDLFDALHIGRLQWRDIPAIIPNAIGLITEAKVDPDAPEGNTRNRPTMQDIRRLCQMGPRGADVLQEYLRNAFIQDVAEALRETGVVGFRRSAAALNEMRVSSKNHLFGQPDREDVEEEMYVLCVEVLHSLKRDALAAGTPREDAPQRAIAAFGEMTEPQVIKYAQQKRLPLSLSRTIDVSGVKEQRTVSFKPTDVQQLPTNPVTVTPGKRAHHERRAKLLPLPRIVESHFPLTTDDGIRVELNANETMHLLSLVNAQGSKPIEMTVWSAEGNPTFTLPMERGLRRQLGERAKESLGRAVEEAVARFDAMELDHTPRRMAEPRSLGMLVQLWRESDGDLAATLHGYVDRSFADRMHESNHANVVIPQERDLFGRFEQEFVPQFHGAF